MGILVNLGGDRPTSNRWMEGSPKTLYTTCKGEVRDRGTPLRVECYTKPMSNTKRIEWVLRIGVAGEFAGHGLLAIGGKADWVGWISKLIHISTPTATTLLLLVGLLDIAVAIIVLVRPISWVLLWATFWGFLTALVRPLVGQSVLDFIERFANWAAPLALFYLLYRNDRKS